MSNTILVKRSDVPNKVPLVTDLELGEFAINTYDGRVFTKRYDGNDEVVVEVGAGGGSSHSHDNKVILDATTAAFTVEQADAIVANTTKVGITQQQADAIVANTTKVGITQQQADAIVANTAKVGITQQQADEIVANASSRHIHANHLVLDGTTAAFTVEQADAIVANTAKVGITQQQADAIVANTAKETNVTTDLSYTAAATEGTVVSSDGTDATIPAATQELAGLMTAADKVKLDGLSGGSGGGDTAVFTSTNYTASSNEIVIADSSVASFPITLPVTPITGDRVTVIDEFGSFPLNPVTVDRNGSSIQGADENVSLLYGETVFVFDGTTWQVFSKPASRFKNPVLLTASGPTAGIETETITITIDNYDPIYTYGASGSGTVSRVLEIINWTLPSVMTDAPHTLTITRTLGIVTETLLYTVEVINLSTVADGFVAIYNFNSEMVYNEGWVI